MLTYFCFLCKYTNSTYLHFSLNIYNETSFFFSSRRFICVRFFFISELKIITQIMGYIIFFFVNALWHNIFIIWFLRQLFSSHIVNEMCIITTENLYISDWEFIIPVKLNNALCLSKGFNLNWIDDENKFIEIFLCWFLRGMVFRMKINFKDLIFKQRCTVTICCGF